MRMSYSGPRCSSPRWRGGLFRRALVLTIATNPRQAFPPRGTNPFAPPRGKAGVKPLLCSGALDRPSCEGQSQDMPRQLRLQYPGTMCHHSSPRLRRGRSHEPGKPAVLNHQFEPFRPLERAPGYKVVARRLTGKTASLDSNRCDRPLLDRECPGLIIKP